MNDVEVVMAEPPPAESPAAEIPAADGPESIAAAAGDYDPQLEAVPEELERRLPVDFLRAASRYRVDEFTSSGAAAFGPGSTAVSVQLSAGRKPFWVREYDESVLRDQIQWYTPVAADEQLSKLLDGRGLACLVGGTGTGRTTTAQVALTRRHGPGRVRLIEFAQRGSLRDLLTDREVWSADRGYLLRLPANLALRRDLAALRMAVRRHESTIVVIVDDASAPNGIGEFRVDHEQPAATEVFWNQLNRRLPSCDGCVGHDEGCGPRCPAALRRLTRTDQRLRQALTGAGDLVTVADLAAEIAHRRPADTAQLAEILGGLHGRSLQTARETLAVPDDADAVTRHQAVQSQVHLIAYAMLVDCPMTLVADAAKALLEKTDPNHGRGIPDIQPQGLGVHISRLIPARLRPEAGDGEVAAETIARFKHRNLVNAFLEVTWNDYPASHDALLEWLYRLTDDRRALVRQRAGATAAILAGFAPETVFTKLINLWASGHRAHYRHAAAVACTAAAEDKRLRPLVIRYLREWMNFRGFHRPLFLDTVARADMVGLGEQVPRDQALQDITKVARDSKLVIGSSVALALKTLGETGLDAVIAMVSQWIKDEHPSLSLQAALAMPRLAELTVEADATVRPSLLEWASTDLSRLPELTRLWRHSLLLPATSTNAWKALGAWAGLAGLDPNQTKRFCRLVAAICDEAVFAARLEFYLHRVWPPVDGALHSKLMEIVKGQFDARTTT